jgi:hypothetical protein
MAYESSRIRFIFSFYRHIEFYPHRRVYLALLVDMDAYDTMYQASKMDI